MRNVLPQRTELGFLDHLVGRRLSQIGFRKIKDETFLILPRSWSKGKSITCICTLSFRKSAQNLHPILKDT